VSAKKFRVWIEQINQTMIEVTAQNPHEAREKAIRKWKRDGWGDPIASYVECEDAEEEPR
jgi:hypothetical protein